MVSVDLMAVASDTGGSQAVSDPLGREGAEQPRAGPWNRRPRACARARDLVPLTFARAAPGRPGCRRSVVPTLPTPRARRHADGTAAATPVPRAPNPGRANGTCNRGNRLDRRDRTSDDLEPCNCSKETPWRLLMKLKATSGHQTV